MRSPPASASPAPSATTGPSSISASTRCRSWRPTTCTTRSRRPPSTPGLPVLCEKPLARTVPEAADLVARAAAAGVVTKLGFVFRYSPALRQLRALVRDGYVGRVHSLAVYSQNPQFMDPAAPFHWKMDAARTGGGVFVEYGSHSLDLARWIAGEIEEVCANARTVVPDRPDPPRAGGGTSRWTTCARGWARRRAASRACSTRAGRRSVSPGATLRSSATAAPSSGGAGTTPGPSPSCSGRRRPLPRSRRLRFPVDLTAGLEWATTWRECFMGNLARAFVAEVGGAPVGGPDLLRWLPRPAGPRRDRDLARRAALGR